MKCYGIDLGGTGIKAGLVEGDRLVAELSAPTPVDLGPEGVMDAIAQLARQLGPARALGVGTPGSVNPQNGRVLYCNNLHWIDVDLAGGLSSRLGVPVSAANDASLAALAETRLGAAMGAGCAAVVTLGTGVGCGVTLGGNLWPGPSGAPEFGHTTLRPGGRQCTCGRKGCFEVYCSAGGLVRSAAEKGLDVVDAREFFVAVDRGDSRALQVLDCWLDDLAEGLGNVANAYRPEVIALGGGLSKSGTLFLPRLKEKFPPWVYGQGTCGLPWLELCRLGYRAGMLGAALWAQERI